MTLKYLRNWLSACPYIASPVTLEYLEATPGAVALFAEDARELSRRQDVVGNVWVTCRSRFSLLRRVPRCSDGEGCTQWLLDLHSWLQEKSVRGETPQLGTYINRVRITAQESRLQEDTADGMGIYKVSLDVEYVKIYPAR